MHLSSSPTFGISQKHTKNVPDEIWTPTGLCPLPDWLQAFLLKLWSHMSPLMSNKVFMRNQENIMNMSMPLWKDNQIMPVPSWLIYLTSHSVGTYHHTSLNQEQDKSPAYPPTFTTSPRNLHIKLILRTMTWTSQELTLKASKLPLPCTMLVLTNQSQHYLQDSYIHWSLTISRGVILVKIGRDT